MSQRQHKTVLFLGTGNDSQSRVAELLFNSVAGKMGLPWRASSRSLAPERGGSKVGPMTPAQVTPEELEAADRVVAWKQDEHLPLLQERFPAWAEKVEFWHVEGPEAPALIEREVMSLVARILGGRERPTEQTPEPARRAPTEPARKPLTVKVGRETAGRRGKGVTTVFDVPLDESGLKELAATLKQRCGTGGTVKDGRIEIQGNQRERIVAELEKLGYKVKRVGG